MTISLILNVNRDMLENAQCWLYLGLASVVVDFLYLSVDRFEFNISIFILSSINKAHVVKNVKY